MLETSPIVLGALGSLAAGLATGVGALPIFAVRQVSDQVQDVMLGFAAGVMLAASFFSLILPGLDAAYRQGAGDVAAAIWITSAASCWATPRCG